jgi:hypothetical protein
VLNAGFTVTVNRYDPAAVDKFGHRAEPATHTIPGCLAAPAGSTETTSGEVLTLEKDTLYAPYDADVEPTDEVVIPAGTPLDAGTYQVDGTPARWPFPVSGDGAGAVIRLQRATS